MLAFAVNSWGQCIFVVLMGMTKNPTVYDRHNNLLVVFKVVWIRLNAALWLVLLEK
jgi:hypothetical protein